MYNFIYMYLQPQIFWILCLNKTWIIKASCHCKIVFTLLSIFVPHLPMFITCFVFFRKLYLWIVFNILFHIWYFHYQLFCICCFYSYLFFVDLFIVLKIIINLDLIDSTFITIILVMLKKKIQCLTLYFKKLPT